jgi:hypothetical protein
MTSSFAILSSSTSHSFLSSEPISDPSSDDEIVLDITDFSISSSGSSFITSSSEDDYIVLGRPGWPSSRLSTPSISTPISVMGELIPDFAQLSIGPLSSSTSSQPSRSAGKKKKSKTKAKVEKAKAKPANTTTTATTAAQAPRTANAPPKKSSCRSKTKQKPLSTAASKVSQPSTKSSSKVKVKSRPAAHGLGSRPIVDDVSENGQEEGSVTAAVSMYDEAVKYINTFLSNPSIKDSRSRLTLLQSLIIELGLCTPPPRTCQATPTSAVPGSLTAAKALLKSRAFVNIHEYIRIRGQGQAALQRAVYPSRSALIKGIQKKGNRASLQWVKKHGLQVLLVTCY